LKRGKDDDQRALNNREKGKQPKKKKKGVGLATEWPRVRSE